MKFEFVELATKKRLDEQTIQPHTAVKPTTTATPTAPATSGIGRADTTTNPQAKAPVLSSSDQSPEEVDRFTLLCRNMTADQLNALTPEQRSLLTMNGVDEVEWARRLESAAGIGSLSDNSLKNK